MGLGSAWLSGLRLYAAVAALGLLGRYGRLDLPAQLDVLMNPWVIGTASFLYTVEFFADKIPYLDTAWDAVHTFIRIPAGAVLAAMAFGEFETSIQVIAGLVGGTLALGTHGAKATTRLALNTSPEPVSNFAASSAEDVAVWAGIAALVFNPWVMIGIVLVSTILCVLIIRQVSSYLGEVGKGLTRLGKWMREDLSGPQ
jgi:hypothetical protein